MSRRLLSVALASGLVSACTGQSSDTAPERLMDRHLKARGGRAILENLRVIERSGSFTYHGMNPEAKGTYHTCLRYPDRVVVDIDAGPVQVHQVLGHHGALECDVTFKTCKAAHQEVVEGLKKTVQTANREELDEQIPDRSTLQPIREGTIQTGYRYKKEDRMVEVDFVPDTGLLRRVKSGTRERHYGDWRDAGGVLIPMRLEDSEDGKKTITIVLSYAEHRNDLGPWCEQRLSAKASDAQQ